MHELSIVESFLKVAIDHAEKADAKKIVRISLVIGEMTGVVEEAVSFYFNFLSKDTIASGAEIDFTLKRTRLRCRDCENLFYPEKHEYACPACGSQRVDIVGGKELHVDSIEVE